MSPIGVALKVTLKVTLVVWNPSSSHSSENITCQLLYAYHTCDWRASVAFNWNCCIETERLLKVTNSHVPCESVPIWEMLQDTHCYYDLVWSVIWPTCCPWVAKTPISPHWCRLPPCRSKEAYRYPANCTWFLFVCWVAPLSAYALWITHARTHAHTHNRLTALGPWLPG